MKPIKPTYLGDGVYIRSDGHFVILTTGHDEEHHATNIIYLEPEVLSKLLTLLNQPK